eukprot:196674_1
MGNSQPKKQGKDPKINKLIDFMYGLVDDAVVTDEEWEELEEYKKKHNISTTTYIKALKEMGYTMKDVVEMRETKGVVALKSKEKPSNVYVDNSTVSHTAIYVAGETKSKANKSSNAPKTKTKIKLRADGSLDKRTRAYKALKEAGVDTSDVSAKEKKKKPNRKRKTPYDSDDTKEELGPPKKKQKVAKSEDPCIGEVVGKNGKSQKVYKGSKTGAIYHKTKGGNKSYIKDKEGRTLYHGAKGGVYYKTKSGSKKYVEGYLK